MHFFCVVHKFIQSLKYKFGSFQNDDIKDNTATLFMDDIFFKHALQFVRINLELFNKSLGLKSILLKHHQTLQRDHIKNLS